MNPKGKTFPWQVFGLEKSAEDPQRKCDGCSFKVFTTLNVHSGLWFTLYDNQRCQRRRGFGETVKTTTKMKKTVTTAFNPVKNSHWKVLFSRAMQKTIYFILYTLLYSIIQCMAEQKRFSNQKIKNKRSSSAEQHMNTAGKSVQPLFFAPTVKLLSL